jgi:hypothetical protein
MSDFVVHRQNNKVFIDVGLTDNPISSPLNINSFSLYAFQIWWEDYVAGTADKIIIEATNDISDKADSSKVYTQVTAFAPVGTTGSVLLNVEKAAYAILRFRLVTDTGTGTFNAILNGKIM